MPGKARAPSKEQLLDVLGRQFVHGQLRGVGRVSGEAEDLHVIL
jgi:hypothetical protein